jgi:archaellum component FlaC
MIAKIKQLWYDLINKGGKEMPTTESTTTRKLKEQVKSQASEISSLRTRISNLIDEIHLIRNDIGIFKKDVTEDMRMIVERINQ